MNQKGFIGTVLVVAIVVVAVGGYLAFSRLPEQGALWGGLSEQQKTTESPENQERGGSQLVIPSDGSIIDARDLATHKNESCGFEIKLPSQFANKEMERCPKYTIPHEIPIENYKNETAKADFVSCGGAPLDNLRDGNGLPTTCSYY